MARETSAKMVQFVEAMAREAGLDFAGAIEGLALAEVDWSRFGARVDWDEFALLAERLCGHMSDDELRELGRTYFRVHPWVAMAARISGISSRLLVHFALHVSRPAHRHWSWEIDCFTSPAFVRIAFPAEYRGCRPIMAAMVGELEVLPEIVVGEGLRVDARVGSHEFEAWMHFDEPARSADKAYAAGRHVVQGALREAERLMTSWLAADHRSPVPSVLEIQKSLALTRAEARVAHRLARGLSVTECAEDLGVSRNTVRTHLSRIYAKTGQRTQAALVSHLLRG